MKTCDTADWKSALRGFAATLAACKNHASQAFTLLPYLTVLLVAFAVLTARATAAPVPAPLLVDQAVFTNDVFTGHGYGNAVAVHGNTAVVGVEGGDPFASVQVFERTGASWNRLGRLSDSRAFIADGFGYSVAVNGNTIAVGDPEQDTWRGAAYVYSRNSGPGLNAWNVLDNSGTASGPSYWVSLTPAQQGAVLTNAWRYSVTARMVHDLEGSVCLYFSAGNTTRRFIFFLDFTDDGDLLAQLGGAAPLQHVLTTNGLRADDYHLHEIDFNPATGMATYRFDGVAIKTWAGENTGTGPGIRWGAGSSTGRGSINVHQTRFEMTGTGTVLASYDAGTPANPPASLDPLAQGWAALVAPGATNTSRGPLTPDAATLWTEQARVTAFDGIAYEQFGNSIALSGDTMVVGAPYHDGLMPATYTNAGGTSIVTTNTLSLTNGMLFTGYKDLVLLFDLLRDYGRTAATLARLHTGRGSAADLAEARRLVSESQRFTLLQGNLLLGVFPGLDPAAVDPQSGLAPAIAGWRQSLTDLAAVQQILTGDANVLGFAPDFLMLLENFTAGGGPVVFDSFDSFQDILDPLSSFSELGAALDALALADATYGAYNGYEDQLASEFGEVTGAAVDRLFQIAGREPGQPGYDTPQTNVGSEIWQQLQSIEVARVRIQKNRTEISNLNKEVAIERNRAASQAAVVVRYANKQATPNRIANEMTAYSTRSWFYNLARNVWQFRDAYEIENVEVEFNPNPFDLNNPPASNLIIEFKERSVAATGWVLSLPVAPLRIQQLHDLQVYFDYVVSQRDELQ